MQIIQTYDVQTPMEYTNQTDSTLMTLLRSAINNAHNKISSITTDPIEFLIETSKFYELAIIQIDASLKLIEEQPEDQTPKTSQKKIITDLITLKNLLHGHLHNTKRSIIQKDKVLMDLDSEPKSQSFDLNPVQDRIKIQQSVMIEQTKSDIDILKERVDLTFKQIDQIEVRSLDKQWSLLIEKEMILIVMKGYMRDQRLEYSEKDEMIVRLMEEQQQSTLQTLAMEEHYMVLLNDCYKDFGAYDDNESINTRLTNEIYQSVLVENMKDMQIKLNFELQKIQDEIHMVLKPLLVDFQDNVNEKLHRNLLRLDEIKQLVDLLSRLAASNRNEELVYKKAFARRCENLLLAETEVDLLGDQVESLQDLLIKIYFILEQNSSVLSQNFQVLDILKIIKKELDGL